MRYLVSDADLGEAEAQAAADVVRSKWLSVGPRTADFETAFAEKMRVEHAVLVSSCTAGLHLALLAVGVGPGDEVLVPSFTFVASVNAILYCGATPVFVDITSEHDFNIDVEDLARKITPRTKAAVVVHLAGYPCEMDTVMSLSDQHGFRVVEDACHAIGAEYAGKPGSPYAGRRAGTIGHAGCFSFFANKNFVTGEGGMVVTHDEAIAKTVRLGRSHGMTKTSWDKASGRASAYDVVQPGFNYRATEITAAIGLIQLEKLDRHNATRRAMVARYRELLADHPDLTLPFADRLDDSAHHIMPVMLRPGIDREALRNQLQDAGVQTTLHYPPVHRFSHIAAQAPDPGPLPVTDDVSARELTLPLHPLLTTDDVDAICEIVTATLQPKTTPTH
ncbi:MAG: DegT/DnrJ/EryC1/StrS family aminotransferase [Planctomycetota bacterium]